MLLEVPMVGGALNVAAEQVVERSAYGALLQRDGNRSPWAAPQGIYRTATEDLPNDQGRWICIAVETDAQWEGLRSALGSPSWTAGLSSGAARRAAHDRIDAELSTWAATHDADAAVDLLWSHGVPVGKVAMPHEQEDNPQLRSRQWFSTLVHPVTGANLHGGFPAVFANGPAPSQLHTSPPPMLGQHNREILTGVLGLSDADVDQLEADGIIGTKVGGGMAW
jgi:crotonobetainyl-CoA:carnitine CoA-transferase CaiB-like acyl-CoA transferase